jgi:hypothetical protein
MIITKKMRKIKLQRQKIRIEEVMFDRPSCEYNRMTSYLHLVQTAPAASGYE